jgi:hypothetical protein
MSESPDVTPAKPEAKRGHALWKEHRDAIADRNVEARRRGSAERKVALSRVMEQRRVNQQRESDLVGVINAKLERARARG